MSEDTPTPRPRKKPAKRGPTKAAALKALGLTQEDLDYLKDRNSPPSVQEIEAKTVAQQEAKHNVIEASANLKPGPGFGGDGMSAAPSDPQSHLENRQAPEPTSEIPAAAVPPAEAVWYMRNLRGVEVGFRLSRQSDSSKKRTQLKPRGMRGDIQKLEPGDLQDAELRTQVAFGLVEVIPEGEALEAIKRQYTNAQVAVPTHIAALRNEYGKEYETAPRTLSDEESMGYKVADLDPALMQGKLTDREIARGSGLAAPNLVGPVQTPRPGNIVSDGFMNEPQQALGNASDNDRAQQVDALARSKQFEGPGAGLGPVTVKVEPVQRS